LREEELKPHSQVNSQNSGVRVLVSGWVEVEPLRAGDKQLEALHPAAVHVYSLTDDVQGVQLGKLVACSRNKQRQDTRYAETQVYFTANNSAKFPH